MENVAIHEKIISGMCRLCLSSDGALIDMFSFSSELDSKIADAVTKCTSVHVDKHSELPRTICESCYTQLVKTQNFQKQALKSDKTLQVYLQRLHNDDKQGILKSSEIFDDIDGNSSPEITGSNQNKEYNSTNSAEIKPGCQYSCEEPEMNIVENKVFATTELDVDSSDRDSAFDPNLIIKAEPKINDKDQFDSDTEILNDFAGNQNNIKPENEASNDKLMASYQCDVCNKYFISLDVLREHQQIHTGEKSYHCDLCNKSYVHLSTFKTHLYLHTQEKPYQCDVCNKCFKKSGEMKKHQRVHTGEKPYQCDVCAKCFSSSANFRRHQRVHTGEKPYRCDVCNKRFSFPSSFKNHRRVHTGEKPFQCDVCNKSFSTINHLRTHQRVHTGVKPYRCDFCNKNYSNTDYLKRHQRIHTGDKTNKCDDCDKCFSSLGTLRIHQRVHTGEKPYQCDVCSKCFTQLGALNSHKRKHSSDV